MRILAGAVVLMALGAVCHAEPERWLPVDKDGWTVFTPSADTRLVYVSSSAGDDAMGAAYAPGAAAVGADPFHPVGPVHAFRTMAAAQKLARDGFPDWVLLRRGDSWHEAPNVVSGRSASEPSLIDAYGDGPRPLLLGAGIRLPNRGFRYVALAGLDVYYAERDPHSPDYVSPRKGGSGLSLNLAGNAKAHHLLVEDCAFRMTRGLVLQERNAPVGTLHDIVFRRNLVLDSYPVGRRRCQGMFAYQVDRMLLEENVFDHDGWSDDVPVTGGRATIFNHDTYFSECSDIVFRGNMFLRASSIGNKWKSNNPGQSHDVVLDDNLYVEGEIGLSIGGNTDAPLRFVNYRVTNNVMLDIGRARPTGRTLALYIGMTDWDGGLVANNCLLHQASDEVRNSRAISVGGASTRNVVIRDNVIYGIKTTRSGIVLKGAPDQHDITLSGNAVQFPRVGSRPAAAEGPLAGFVLRGNTYFSSRPAGEWFSVDGDACDLNAWVQKTGEKDAVNRRIAYPDPDRTTETYMASLGKPGTFAAFLVAVRDQRKGHWDPALTAAAVNDYVRAGFGMKRFTAAPPAASAGPR